MNPPITLPATRIDPPGFPEAAPACDRWASVAGYEILGELGHGSMGVVYRARQKSLGRLVALKTIRPGIQGHPDGLNRFISEARVIARLHHPNIVSIYEISLQQD